MLFYKYSNLRSVSSDFLKSKVLTQLKFLKMQLYQSSTEITNKQLKQTKQLSKNDQKQPFTSFLPFLYFKYSKYLIVNTKIYIFLFVLIQSKLFIYIIHTDTRSNYNNKIISY